MNEQLFRLPVEDLKAISRHIKDLKTMFEGSEILLYGGTGFIGCWVTESLLYADLELNLGLKVTIVTRRIESAKLRFSNYVNNKVTYIEHNFATSALQMKFNSDFIFHGSTPTSNATGFINEQEILTASRNAALHAIQSKSTKFKSTKVTHLSSGIIYGNQSMEMLARSELDNPAIELSVYGKAKLEIDKILNTAYAEEKIDFQSPRLFAFAGPNLQLNAHFAVGNFLLNGLRGEPINIRGNPKTIRSYMYPSDLVRSLLSVAVQSNYMNINIGSPEPISMMQLAKLISEITSNSEVILTNPTVESSNYVPSVTNLQQILSDAAFIGIKECILKWIHWLRI
jgi:dTDP-glucose 4,6-dehydratase